MSRPRRGEVKARRGLLVVIVLDRGLASSVFATIMAGPGLQVVPLALYSPECLEGWSSRKIAPDCGRWHHAFVLKTVTTRKHCKQGAIYLVCGS